MSLVMAEALESRFEDLTRKDDAFESSSYPLHKAAFEGNVREVAALVRQGIDLAKKDPHGNTALHIAIMLGQKECVQLLLAHGAPVKAKNGKGWSCLAEAISYGDRPMISTLFRKSKQQLRDQMAARRPFLIKALERIDDFYMELKWDFQSWVPLVSRILPSDVCKIYKRGSSIRMDTTLLDFNDMRWERGDISFIFNRTTGKGGPVKGTSPLVVMDNKLKVFQILTQQETEVEFEEEIDLLMSSDIVVAQVATKGVYFTRAQSGWIFREDRRESVGSYSADIYTVHGVTLESHKRREHLSDEDLQKNKEALVDSFTKPPTEANPNGEDLRHRESLDPPPRSDANWEDYISPPGGDPPCLGRPIVAKSSSKAFKATLAMSEEFPMTVEMLLNILEVVTPFKHLKKLRDFVTMKLPPGFPVRIEIPILPTITAKVVFEEFGVRDDLSVDLFSVPAEYVEKSNRFPLDL